MNSKGIFYETEFHDSYEILQLRLNSNSSNTNGIENNTTIGSTSLVISDDDDGLAGEENNPRTAELPVLLLKNSGKKTASKEIVKTQSFYATLF